MKKTVYASFAALSLLLSLPLSVQAQETCSAPLIAGGGGGSGAVVGDVHVFSDGDYLYVDYVLADDWCIGQAHLQVASSLEGIPMTKKSNPIPGKFDLQDAVDCEQEVNFALPLDGLSGDLLVAAHGVVSTIIGYDANLAAFAEGLPDVVTIKVAHPGTAYGEPSYFDVFVSGGSALDGIYDDYCIDTDRTISPGATYTANVYSSYESIPEGLVEQPENLDLLNYILNQSYPGQASVAGGDFTFGDVQRAIWTLIDDQVSTSGLGSWSQARVDEIIADALANGEGFSPACGDYVGVIFQPVSNNQITIAQVTLASVATACAPIYQTETAWPEGTDFPGNNWAMYMECSF